jgi:1-aminocyclopropane-1-carboxylate synthase
MEDTDPFSADVVERYAARLHEAQAAGTTPRALLLCNPHNPSGRCYPRSTLLALLRFCAQHNLHLISDEVYALTIFETSDATAAPFTSVLALDTAGVIDPGAVHVTYGFSKDFGAPGLHVAAMISRNADVQSAFKAIGLLHAPGGPSCAIGAAILEDEAFVTEIIQLSRRKLAENYAVVTEMLDGAGIPYWKGGRAGFFLWMDLSGFLPPAEEGADDVVREEALSQKLLEGGVWLNPTAEWAERPGWFRLIFSHEKVKVEEGVRR